MTHYRIKKVGRVGENNSYFGDTQEYFEGFAMYPPTIGERFVLWYNKLGGGIVIDTSPVLKIEEGEIHTMYSVYEIEEV